MLGQELELWWWPRLEEQAKAETDKEDEAVGENLVAKTSHPLYVQALRMVRATPSVENLVASHDACTVAAVMHFPCVSHRPSSFPQEIHLPACMEAASPQSGQFVATEVCSGGVGQ